MFLLKTFESILILTLSYRITRLLLYYTQTQKKHHRSDTSMMLYLFCNSFTACSIYTLFQFACTCSLCSSAIRLLRYRSNHLIKHFGSSRSGKRVMIENKTSSALLLSFLKNSSFLFLSFTVMCTIFVSFLIEHLFVSWYNILVQSNRRFGCDVLKLAL